MASTLYRIMRDAGYRRYEISNFARDGYECRHNLRYWQLAEYRGFGISAHSLIGNRRFFNRDGMAEYITDPLSVEEEEELLTPSAREYEYVMLSLRTASGISDAEFLDNFGVRFSEKYAQKIAPFLARGLMQSDGERVFLGEAGMALSNAILSEILDEM